MTDLTDKPASAPVKPAVQSAAKPKTPKKSAPSNAPTGIQNVPTGVGEVKRRRTRLILSFALCVLVPAILGGVYYGKYASDRYAAGAGFVVRGFDGGGGGDLVSSFTGLTSSGSTTSDSYIIRRYLLSGDLLLLLEEKMPLRPWPMPCWRPQTSWSTNCQAAHAEML